MICQKTSESRLSVEGLRSADLADDERARSRLLNQTVLRFGDSRSKSAINLPVYLFAPRGIGYAHDDPTSRIGGSVYPADRLNHGNGARGLVHGDDGLARFQGGL
jgi:hypothetical protein